MLISKEIILEINRRTDIVDVIADYVILKPTGTNYKGLCPFHKEKTPSFTVNRTEGFYHCFGCKESGNSISFLQKYLNINFLEAVQILALRYGIKIDSEYDSRQETEESIMYKLYDIAKDFYENELYRIGEIALKYYKQRNLSDETILKFGLGYSSNNFDALVKHFSRSNYSSDILIKSGLLREKYNKQYDFFRNRAMFPIRDFIGRTMAFGGRQLEKNDLSGKYINSSDSLIYNKKHTLYGLYEGKTEIRKEKSAFIVEGYFDVISLSQHGMRNVVAPCGTSLSVEQLFLLKKHTGCEKLYFMFDGDEAGKNATFKGIEFALQTGFDLQIIDLFDGDDPDTLINSDGGKEKILELKSKSKNFVEYMHYVLNSKNMLQSPAEKSTAVRNLVKLILSIPDKLQHKYYIDFIKDLFNVDMTELQKLYAKLQKDLNTKELKKSYVQANQGDLKDLINPENIIEDFVKNPENKIEENLNIENNLKEELHSAERAVFIYVLKQNENFRTIKNKYTFNENFLISNLGKDIYYWLTEFMDNENIFQSLLSDKEVPLKIKELLSELKLSEVRESKYWSKFSNIKTKNSDIELIEFPLLELKLEQIQIELIELGKKITKITDFSEEIILLRRHQELIEQRKKYINMLEQLKKMSESL